MGWITANLAGLGLQPGAYVREGFSTIDARAIQLKNEPQSRTQSGSRSLVQFVNLVEWCQAGSWSTLNSSPFLIIHGHIHGHRFAVILHSRSIVSDSQGDDLAIAFSREHRGLPPSSVDYGAIGETGATQIRLSASGDDDSGAGSRAATAIRMFLNGIKVDGISLR